MAAIRELLDVLQVNVEGRMRQLDMFPGLPSFDQWDGRHRLPRVIGLVGRMHSGKSTAGQYLRAKYDYREAKFAKPLKHMIRTYLHACGVDPDTQERMIEGDLKEVPTHHFGGRTTRAVMQTLGTNWGRNMVDEDLWVRPMSRLLSNAVQRFVVTDVRFQNELDALADKGLTIKIVRYSKRQTPTALDHESEQYIDGLTTASVVANDGTIEDLYANIDDCLYNWAASRG